MCANCDILNTLSQSNFLYNLFL
uniref:Uncharacterized protein n=1 Tax=Anguilla anguilla TaxID=7936 RepID=A0A0E9SFI3_ANGAN